MLVLIWRLYVALETQHVIENSLASTSETLEIELLTAAEQIQAQNATVDLLTQDKNALQAQSDQQVVAIAQLKSDHQALQEKYSGLERNLINTMTQEKTLSETLQTYKLNNAKLQRETELLLKSQAQWETEQQALLIQHQAMSDQHQKYLSVIQAAKEKISTIETEKKQLERDLQKALYQVVALEQAQKPMSELIGITDQRAAVYEDEVSEPLLPSFKS